MPGAYPPVLQPPNSHPSEEPWSHGTEALLPTPLRPWGGVLVAAKSKCHDFRRSSSRCFFFGSNTYFLVGGLEMFGTFFIFPYIGDNHPNQFFFSLH